MFANITLGCVLFLFLLVGGAAFYFWYAISLLIPLTKCIIYIQSRLVPPPPPLAS